ncbi:MAG: 6-bladed beta-propeller [Bacteroidales bacterium]|jgi:hypothetical protein|nr:6-bladed beta-propeller [Bacteroidales bacterium]
MEKLTTIMVILLLTMAGCIENKQPADDFIIVDVTANYPKEELLLQDFMDVEYVPLETNDEFVCQDLVVDVTKNRIIVRNRNQEGDIFIFDRNGKAIKRINRKGQGAEEYNLYSGIVLDEDKAEIFVNDLSTHRTLVYDLEGNYKRTLKQGDDTQWDYMYNFDRENLISNNSWKKVGRKEPFAIISKTDGSLTEEIQISTKDEIHMRAEFELDGKTYFYTPESHKAMIPYLDSWILVEQSSDTVYRYRYDHTLTPFIVRTPSIQSMIPRVFLFPSMFTRRYYFMEVVTVEIDRSRDEWFPATSLMYDKQEDAISRYTVYNGDYTEKRPVNINRSTTVSSEIVACISIQSYQLMEDYEKGKLKGRLAEIAAGLNEESNPVIMLIKHKKAG